MTDKIYFGDLVKTGGLKGYIVPNIYSSSGFSLDLETFETVVNGKIIINPNFVYKNMYTSEKFFLFYDLETTDFIEMEVVGNAIDDYNKYHKDFQKDKINLSKESLHLFLQRLNTYKRTIPHVKSVLLLKDRYSSIVTPEGTKFWKKVLEEESSELTEEEMDMIKSNYLTPYKVLCEVGYPLLEACRNENNLKTKYFYYGAVYNLRGIFGTLIPDKSSETGISIEIEDFESYNQLYKFSHLLRNKYILPDYEVTLYPIHRTEVEELLYVGSFEEVFMKGKEEQALLSPLKLHIGLQMLSDNFHTGVGGSVYKILSEATNIFDTPYIRERFGDSLSYEQFFSAYCGITEEQEKRIESERLTLKAVDSINSSRKNIETI